MAKSIVLASGKPDISMTSLNIAAMTGKEHKNVMRDIKELLSELGVSELTYTDAQGKKRKDQRTSSRRGSS